MGWISLRNILRILIFSLIYFLITNESLYKYFLVLATTFILLKLLEYFQEKNLSFQYLLIVSFLFLIPLTLKNNIQVIFLPIGYQYIYISLISSLIYIDSKRKNLKSSFFNKLSNTFLATIAPLTYISGPSANFEEVNIKNKSLGLLSVENIKIVNIKLAISGALRISLGIYLNSINTNIFNVNFFSNEVQTIYLFLNFLIYGFFNFWRYYLLFSGASELCKAFLTLFKINVIDNFKNPENAIYYHEIWGKWHLNITKRIKDFLYTPLTLFMLRNFNLKNKYKNFFLIEGLPVSILFLVISLWHGGKISDFIFAGLSIVFTLGSRAISQTKVAKENITNNKIIKEIIRFLSLSLFGIVLGIYDLDNNEQLNSKIEFVDSYLMLFITLIIYIYYRLKYIFYKINNNKIEIRLFDKYILFFESIIVIYINLFLIIDLEKINDFIYFDS